ncbi:signal transducer and activator of transcription 5A [Galendromus occidentalis]|uniref:Signal transducer and activator of transcription n=1 Tax=Galendromus occidentalis TaxID=34638 RepID=A0AAJ6VUZ1_9ACAR|nr:signal transducer and activator of transcription 5A [Galendromus occidentalis]
MEMPVTSSWDRIQRLPCEYQEQTLVLYSNLSFPIEVRKALSDWIDKQNWQSLVAETPEVKKYMLELANDFFSVLEEHATRTLDPAVRNELAKHLNNLKLAYVQDPAYLMCVLRNCILSEEKIFRMNDETLAQSATLLRPDPAMTIQKDLEASRLESQRMEEKIKAMHEDEEAFVFPYQNFRKRAEQLQQLRDSNQPIETVQRAQLEYSQFEALINAKTNELHSERLDFLDKLSKSLQCLNGLRHLIIDEHLAEWQRLQQLAGNGLQFESNLNQIQAWCESLAELAWQHLQLVRRLELLITKIPTTLGPSLKEQFSSLETQIKALLSALVRGTFVIEEQPPQVLKTNTRFKSTVRLLVGGQLNVHMSPPKVEVSIMSETQASNLARNEGHPTNEVSGEILNSISAMEYHQATKQLSVSFRNMSLKGIKRAEKKGSESVVMDEKFCLLFQSVIKVADMTFAVQARSLPVVVIVHGNQEPHALATITWDNAFSDSLRKPFQVPERVPWSKMAQVLSMKFRAATGAGLSESNLHFLATKALRKTNLGADFGEYPVTWSQFCKEPLRDRNFTFWEWFYAIMKLTREHLKPLWVDGLVWGFIGRQEAEEMLLKRAVGTFLLRFSDSEQGGLTIAYVVEQEGLKKILMIKPFTSVGFKIRSLADILFDLKNLLYLYPDIPKDQAFQRYYTSAVEQSNGATANGYVKPLLVTQLPGMHQPSYFDSNAASPASHYGAVENSMQLTRNDGSYDPNSIELMDYLIETDLLDIDEFDLDFSAVQVSLASEVNSLG